MHMHASVNVSRAPHVRVCMWCAVCAPRLLRCTCMHTPRTHSCMHAGHLLCPCRNTRNTHASCLCVSCACAAESMFARALKTHDREVSPDGTRASTPDVVEDHHDGDGSAETAVNVPSPLDPELASQLFPLAQALNANLKKVRASLLDRNDFAVIEPRNPDASAKRRVCTAGAAACARSSGNTVVAKMQSGDVRGRLQTLIARQMRRTVGQSVVCHGSHSCTDAMGPIHAPMAIQLNQ